MDFWLNLSRNNLVIADVSPGINNTLDTSTLYILGAVALVLMIYGMIVIFKRGNKEFNPKLSLKERLELEKMVEKKVKEEGEKEEETKEELVLEAEKKVAEPVEQKVSKLELPSKEIDTEMHRYETHVDIGNTKVQQSIRNGVQNFLNQDHMLALEEFSLSTESNPNDATGFYCRGLTKLALKNYESALADFTEAINLKFKGPNAFYFRALAYFNIRDLDNAILNFNAYINQEKNNSEAYFDLGLCFKEKDKIKEALQNFSLAIQKRPAFGAAYFERGLLRHKQDDKEGGCADLKKAFGLGYLEADSYLTDLCGNGSD